MIDRKARNQLAELILSLSAGILTNDEFEDALPRSMDAAILEVVHHGSWCLYTDAREHRLEREDALTADDLSAVARWVLFLKSDIEYTWPSASFQESLLKTISFGLFGQKTLTKWHRHGDVSCWPFSSIHEFEQAKLKGGYLGIRHT